MREKLVIIGFAAFVLLLTLLRLWPGWWSFDLPPRKWYRDDLKRKMIERRSAEVTWKHLLIGTAFLVALGLYIWIVGRGK